MSSRVAPSPLRSYLRERVTGSDQVWLRVGNMHSRSLIVTPSRLAGRRERVDKWPLPHGGGSADLCKADPPRGLRLRARPLADSPGRWWPDLQGPHTSPTAVAYRPMGCHQESPTRRPGATFRPTRCPGASPRRPGTAPGLTPRPGIAPGLTPRPGIAPGLTPRPGIAPGLTPRPGTAPEVPKRGRNPRLGKYLVYQQCSTMKKASKYKEY